MDGLSILHLVQSIGLESAGIGTSSTELVRGLLGLGCQATIWTLDPQPASRLAQERSLPPHAVRCFPSYGPKAVGYCPKMEAASKRGGGQRVDLLHQHGIWMANSRVTNGWRKAFGRPTVLSPRGSLEEYALGISRWKKYLAAHAYEAENLGSATCLLATSNQEARSFRNYGLTQPVAVIPNGVSSRWLASEGDGDKFREEFGIPKIKRICLFLSRVHPQKGLPLLFEALAGLHRDLGDWLFVVAGPSQGGHRRELERSVEHFSIVPWIRFTGPLYGEMKRHAFASAELFVLPTRSENFGNVVAEALGVGLPVIATRGAPWEDLITGRCGWWTDIKPEALKEALFQAIRMTDSELAAMGERGRRLVSAKYTWRNAAQKTLVLYRWLLGDGPTPDFIRKD